MQAVFDRIDELPKPALIALTIIGFVLFWPLGLAMLVICICRGRMFCSHRGYGRWYSPEDRDAFRSEWRARKEEWRAWKRRARWSSRHGLFPNRRRSRRVHSLCRSTPIRPAPTC